MLSSHLVDEQDVEAQPKSDDEDDEDDGKLGNSVDDVVEHEDEDAKVADEAKLEEEVQPGGRDDEGSKGPLPALKRDGSINRKKTTTHRSSTASESLQLSETGFLVIQSSDAQVEQEEHGEQIENPVDQVSDVEVASLTSDDL